jgi:membrane protein
VAGLLKQTLSDWFSHRCMSKGAALAFYALFSLAPILVLVIALAGAFFGREAATGEIVRQFGALVGRDGAEAVEVAIASADQSGDGLVASMIALGTLLVGSTTAFAELKESLDEIWFGRIAPSSGIVHAIKTRMLSFGLVLVLAFLLLVSLMVSAALAVFTSYWSASTSGVVASGMSWLVTFVVITALFAAIYKLLPPARLSWGDVMIGAVLTALLFEVGKHLIGLYLGNAAVTSSFGAAGSLGVLALWVYYSAQIFFLGAEFTRLYARSHGSLRNPANQKGGIRHENGNFAPDPETRRQAHGTQ